MDLTELWWSAVGLFFLSAPFVVAAVGGIALPAGALALARSGSWWSDETKLSLMLSALIVSPAVATAVSGRVFYTDKEVAMNPALAALPDSALAEWVTRLGAALLLGVAVPEIVRWLMGARRMHVQAKRLLVAAVLYYVVTIWLAGLGGEFRFFRLHVLYMPVMFAGLALLASADLTRPLLALRWSLWLIMIGCLLSVAVAPRLARELDYDSFLPGMTWRLVGLMDSANSLGALAVIALVLELSGDLVHRARWWVVAPALAVLVLAQSKTAWAEALIALVMIGAVRASLALFGTDRSRAGVGWWAAGLLAAALALIGVGAFIESERALAWLEGSGLTSFTGRTAIWSITWGEFERAPFLGFGPSLWDVQYRFEHGMTYVGHAHNQFIHTLGQAGLAGGVTLLIYVALMTRMSWLSWRAGFTLPLVALMILMVRGLTEAPLLMNSIIGTDALCHALAFFLAAAGVAVNEDDANAEVAWQDSTGEPS